MKKLNYIILTVLVLSLIITVQGTPETKGERGKTMQIGKMSWYTEHNTFDDIVKIAKKENKPILAVFSATWCKPCQHVKKYVLAKDEFKKVADKMVLLYIEQTDPKAAAYINKFKVMSYPTFTFFTKEGKELETGHPERTVDGFLKWIDDINSGNSFYELSEKLKEEPGNRKIMMKLAGKMGWQQRDEVVKLARKVIELNPDFNDPISKKA
ncbi:MAG: thioredoxin family protein [bacterium]|nr:thioredoxin family protein [bacterium]